MRVLLVALANRLLKGDDNRSTDSVRAKEKIKTRDVLVGNLVVVLGSVHTHEGGIHLRSRDVR